MPFAHDTFMYSAEKPDGHLFRAGEDLVGDGWVDSPALIQAAEAAPVPPAPEAEPQPEPEVVARDGENASLTPPKTKAK